MLGHGDVAEDVEPISNAGTFEGVLEELLCFDGSEVRVAFVNS